MGEPDGVEGRRSIPVAWLVAPIIVATVLNFVGDAIGPGLITSHPAVQLMLSPKNRYFVLAAPQLSAWTFFSVGFFRLVLTDPLFFLLGVYHGDTALAWAERRLGENGAMIRTAERWFKKAAPLIILIAPTSYLNLMAGAAGMKVRLYVVLNIVGTAARLSIFWFFGAWFSDELGSVLDWLRTYRWWVVAPSVAIVGYQVARQWGSGLLSSPTDIAEEFDAIEETAEGEVREP
jgi:membrane protein DedA with SNARE-associated domain